MATFVITGLAARRPVEAMTSRPEGGGDAALAVAASLLDGRAVSLVGTGTLLAPAASEDGDLLLATYGDTVVLLGAEADEVEVPDGAGRYTFVRQSVTDSVVVEVDAAPFFRMVALSPGAVDVDEGEPLEFEVPFWSGEHDEYPGENPAFDTDEWGSAAMLWLFGWDPSGRTPGPVDPAIAPLHTVRPV